MPWVCHRVGASVLGAAIFEHVILWLFRARSLTPRCLISIPVTRSSQLAWSSSVHISQLLSYFSSTLFSFALWLNPHRRTLLHRVTTKQSARLTSTSTLNTSENDHCTAPSQTSRTYTHERRRGDRHTGPRALSCPQLWNSRSPCRISTRSFHRRGHSTHITIHNICTDCGWKADWAV